MLGCFYTGMLPRYTGKLGGEQRWYMEIVHRDDTWTHWDGPLVYWLLAMYTGMIHRCPGMDR